MPLPRPVYIRAETVELSWADATRNLQELVFSAAHAALAGGGVPFAALDSVVLAAHDMVDGRSLSSMVTAPAAGAYLRDEVRLGEDGAAALAMATLRVAAGLSENCMVCAWGRASEGSPEAIAGALFDPFFARPLGMTEVAVSGLRASAALRERPRYGEARAAAAERRASAAAADGRAPAGGAAPPPAWPLRAGELPRWCDIVAALVLTSEPTAVRVGGVAMSSEPYWLGDRDLLGLPALREASAQALAAAGRTVRDVALFELDGLTLFDEALALEAVGGAGRGQGMTRIAGGAPFNECGGYALGYCAPAMGLVRAGEAARRLRERGDGVALASGGSTVAAQTQAAVVLEACP
jgi:acetyl-CoA C-acetyltransferase